MENNTVERHWFEDWFDENYLLLYKHRNKEDAGAQIRLIINELKPDRKKIILDLGCGEGRYTEQLASLGYDVIGLDLSRTLVFKGKGNHKNLKFVVGDMNHIPGKFDIILSLFTSFGYYRENEKNRNIMKSIYDALNLNGFYWLDFLNPISVRKNLVPRSDTKLAQDIHVTEKRKIKENCVVKDIRFKEKGEEKIYQEMVYLYGRLELEQMMREIGFEIIKCFGDYEGSPWNQDSPRTIILAGKK